MYLPIETTKTKTGKGTVWPNILIRRGGKQMTHRDRTFYLYHC